VPGIHAIGRDERGRGAVIELHLIGYTEDAASLVLDLDADGEGRYLVAVDPDLLATLEAVRDQRVAAGLPVDGRAPASVPEPSPTAPSPPDEESGPEGSGVSHPEASTARPGDAGPGANGDAAARRDEVPDDGGTTGPPDAPGEDVVAPADEQALPVAPRSRLSPAEIQAQLRAGRSVRALAREAGTDPAWIERWQAPILAERERILADARGRRIEQPHARALGGSVERNLSDRGVEPEETRWQVSRRHDGRWRVTVRFDEDGRPRAATWLLDPAEPHLRPQSPLATELASPRRRARPRRR
jgi:hypothetical protein